jgi:O-antigen/teichoic acid export membrane protein
VSTRPHPHAADPAHGTTLAKGAALNIVALVASNLRGLFTLLVARLLGDTALGTFGVAWAAMDLASKCGTLGLDYRLTALVAESESAGDQPRSRWLFRRSLRLSGAAALVTAALGAGLAVTSAQLTTVQPSLALATAVMFSALPGLVLYRVSNAVSRGMKVMRHDIISRGLTDSLVSATALVVFVLLGMRTLAPELAAAAGSLGSGIVAWHLARRLFKPGPVPADAGRPPSLLRESLPVALYDFLNILIMRLDVVMLGLFVGRAPDVTLQTLGIYAASVEVAGGLRKVSQAFTPIFTPVVAEYMATGRRHEAEESYACVARWMLAILLPAVAVLALSGGAILSLFGTAFRPGARWLAIVGAACALNAFVGLGETILMIARPRWNVINTTVACVAAIGLNLWLIPLYGPVGAALAMLVPYAVQGVLRGLEISRLLGWRLRWRALVRPWAAALSALPLALFVRGATSGLGGEIGAGTLYVLTYLGAWCVLGLEPADRAILDRLRYRFQTTRDRPRGIS